VEFEWDLQKSETNKAKHGIGFETAVNLWSDEYRVEIHAPYPTEDRHILLGKYRSKLWAAIYTMRGESVRLISVRRARKREVNLYEKENVGPK